MAARRLRAGVIATVDEDALVLVAGIGAARASAAAGALAQHGVVGMLSVGVATATVPGLHCGTLLLPSRVAGADGEVLQVDPAWRAAWLARAQGVPVDERPLGEAPRVLEDGDARRRFARDAGVAAADMESAAVLRVAASAGVPAVVLRVVLDEVAVRLPAAALVALEESGAVSWPRGAASGPGAVAAPGLRPPLLRKHAAIRCRSRRRASASGPVVGRIARASALASRSRVR